MGFLRAPIRFLAGGMVAAVVTVFMMLVTYQLTITKPDNSLWRWMPCICIFHSSDAPTEVPSERSALTRPMSALTTVPEISPLEVEPFDPAVLAGDPVALPEFALPEFEMPVVEPYRPTAGIGDDCILPPLAVERYIAPQYPNSGRTGQPLLEGYVMVTYDILPDGTVGNARVEDTNLPPAFGDEVLMVARTWRYQPPTNQRAEQCTVTGETQRFEFALDR